MTTEELIAARRAEPWREALRKSKKNKERADIPRVKMNELDPEYRSRTRLEEVNLGLTKNRLCKSRALSGLSESYLYAGMSGKYQYTYFYQEYRAWGILGGR